MNILLVNWRDTKHPQAGGAEVHYHELFKRLVAKGHTVVLLTTRFPGSERQDVQDGIVVYRWGHTYLFNWEAPRFIPAIVKRHAIDCIIDDVNKIPFFTPLWFPKIPTGVFFHHLFGATIFEVTAWPLAMYIRFLENRIAWTYRRRSLLYGVEEHLFRIVARGFLSEHISIIENSVDIDRLIGRRSGGKRSGPAAVRGAVQTL